MRRPGESHWSIEGMAPSRRIRGAHAGRGQTVTEFAFVLPLLMILLLAIADFGRVFQAAIVVQSAARAAAEAAAVEYLRTEDIRTSPPAGWSQAAYFDQIHEVASIAACQEARILPNTTYEAGPPIRCSTWPAVSVCVHDADTVDPACGTTLGGFGSGTADCPELSAAWATTEDAQSHDYVEVRTCYRFTTLFNLQISLPMGAALNIGEIHLQSKGAFVVADY